jgi:hypothetical protein
MLRLILIKPHIALCTHALHYCLCLILVHFAIDHIELELEEPTEQAQVEDFTNLALNQVKPRCIPPKSLSFIFELCL